MHNGPYSAVKGRSAEEIARRTDWLAGLTQDSVAKELASAGLSQSANLLDLGSGVGLRAFLSAIYLARGSVTGIEIDHELVEYARRWTSEKNCRNISFCCGDARTLPFSSGTFNAVRIDSVLWAIADPGRALKEVFRVLKPGGIVLVRNFDMQGLIAFSSPEFPHTVSRVFEAYRSAFRSWGGDLDIGHKIPMLLLKHGFTVTAVSAQTELKQGVASCDERKSFWSFFEQWRDSLVEQDWFTLSDYEAACHDYEAWGNLPMRQQARTFFLVQAKK